MFVLKCLRSPVCEILVVKKKKKSRILTEHRRWLLHCMATSVCCKPPFFMENLEVHTL